MTTRLANLEAALPGVFGDALKSLVVDRGEITVVVAPEQLRDVMTRLRDTTTLKFESLMDVCGVDYSTFGEGTWDGRRFAAVYHLLSLAHNRRLRVRCFAANDDFPVITSVHDIWPAANWFEREAFDLYGIVFDGHPDLRRLLTDYGFVGHPFRKDFPLSGYVEVRYDPEQKRVVYQPVTIEPREVTPRVIREDNYAGTR